MATSQAHAAWYLRSYRRYRAAPYLPTVLLLLAALAVGAAVADDGMSLLARLYMACLGAPLALALVCWPSPLWFSLWFRRLAFFLSSKAGSVLALLHSFWVRSIAFVGLLTLLWLARTMALNHTTARAAALAMLTASNLAKIATATILLALLLRVLAGRKRISIAAFQNLAGDDLKAPAEAIASRLGGLLDHLVNLYQAVDEERVGTTPVSSANERSQAVLIATSISDAGEMLRGAISPDTKVKFGLFELPLAPLVTAGSLLVRGPSLTGNVQRVGNDLTLLARIDGRHIHKTWRLNRTIGPEGAAATLAALTDELAYRIFTALAEPGSQNWRAVRSYSDGLQTILRVTRSRHDLHRNLRDAETKLIQALSEDPAFWPCHYNLGVVYLARSNYPSARAAFSKALAGKPSYADAAEGLCDTLWRERNDAALLRAADLALALRSDSCKAWDWRGWAQRRLIAGAGVPASLRLQAFVPYGKEPLLPETAGEQWPAVIASREIACALAWRDLCAAASRCRKLSSARDTAATFLINAAVAWAQYADAELALTNWRPNLCTTAENRAASLFSVSLGLVRAAHASEELGKLWMLRVRRLQRQMLNNWRLSRLLLRQALRKSLNCAARALREALLIEESPVRWAWLARAEASRAELCSATEGEEAVKATLYALDRSLALPPTDQPTLSLLPRITTLANLTLSADVAGQSARYESQIDMVPAVSNQALSRQQGESAARQIGRLRSLLRQAALIEFGWAQARIAWQIGRIILDRRPKHAENLLRAAAAKLKDSDPFKQDVYSDIVDACRLRERPDLMLAAAQEAVTFGPAQPSARRLLGDALVDLQDYDEAERQFEIALDLDPDDLNTLNGLVRCHVWRSWTQLALEDRRDAQRRSLEVLQSILERTNDPGVISYAQYYLGEGYSNLEQFEKAVDHYTVALKLRYKPLEIRWWIGRIHYYRNAFNEADAALRLAVKDTWNLSRLQSPAPGKPKLRVIPNEFYEARSVNDTLLIVSLWRSLVYADRGPDLAAALKMTRRARWRLQYCAQGDRDQYRAACLACEGWIAHRAGDGVKAIDLLTRSARLTADADTFWRLARICLSFAEEQPDKREEWRRALMYYTSEARSADTRGAYAQRLAAVENALPPDSKTQKPASAEKT